jgi:hypothetical protein
VVSTTGAAGGIGSVLTRRLAVGGSRLVLPDVDASRVDRTPRAARIRLGVLPGIGVLDPVAPSVIDTPTDDEDRLARGEAADHGLVGW